VVTIMASEVVGYEERKNRNDWYDEEYHWKVEERNKASVKIQIRMTRPNIENFTLYSPCIFINYIYKQLNAHLIKNHLWFL
jgi:hypothetical protein